MSKLINFIETHETNVQKLFQKIDEQNLLNQALINEIFELKQQVSLLYQENNNLKQLNQTLKLTQTLAGSEDYKKETKLKINALIKDIDHCISQLSS